MNNKNQKVVKIEPLGAIEHKEKKRRRTISCSFKMGRTIKCYG